MEVKEIKVKVAKGTDSLAIAMMERGFEDNGYYFKAWDGEEVIFTNEKEKEVK